jgi:tetratricopeptide (TPR) repeat protein
MRSRRIVTLVFAGLLVICLAGQALTVRRLDQMRPEKTLEEVLYIPSAKVLRRLSLGYTGVLADIYWTRAVQYFGAKLQRRTRSQRYDLLFPLLDITTSLDPNILPAYEFGSIFLTQKPPLGSDQPEKAVELLRKGIANNPNEWRLYFQLGFVYYLDLKDYPAASVAFRKAGEMPGGNPNVLPIAGVAAQRGGDLATSLQLWKMIYESSKMDLVKKNAQKHVISLQVDLAVPELEGMVERYRQKTGHNPASWAELARAGGIPGIPYDPAGDQFRLLPDGSVMVRHPEKFPFAERGVRPKSELTIEP